MRESYLYTSSILERDISGLTDEHLKSVVRFYILQCIGILERELDKHGGLQTLRVRYVEHRRDIDFIGTNY